MTNNQKKGIAFIVGGVLSYFILPHIFMLIYEISGFYLGQFYLGWIIPLVLVGFGIKNLISKNTEGETSEPSGQLTQTPDTTNSTQIINKKTNSEIIKEAKASFKGQWGKTILMYLLSGLLMIIAFLIGLIIPIIIGWFFWNFVYGERLFGDEYPSIIFCFLTLIYIFISIVLSGRLFVWRNKFILETSRGLNPDIIDLKYIFQGQNLSEIKETFSSKFIMFVIPGLTIALYTLIIIFGYLMLIIPGIIFSFMYAMIPFVLVDENYSVAKKYLKKSSNIMSGHKMKLFLCYLKLIPLFILCALPCGLGLLWFFPFLSFVLAKFYDAHKQTS